MFVILSLLAAVAASTVNFADKAFLSRFSIDYQAASIFAAIAGGLLALAILPFSGNGGLSSFDIALVLVSGILMFGSYFMYWKALSKSDTTIIIMLIQITPVLVLILSYFFLHERLSVEQLIGFVLVLTAVIGFSIDKTQRWAGFGMTGTLVSMILSGVFAGIASVIAKHIIEQTTVPVATAFEGFGVFMGGVLLLALSGNVRRSFFDVMKRHAGAPLIFIFIVEAIWLVYRFLSYAATSLGPVSLERVLEGTRVFFAFIAGALLGRAFPAIFATESKNITVTKIALAGVLFAGIYLIS